MGDYYDYWLEFLQALNDNQGILIVLFIFLLVLLNRNLTRVTRRIREVDIEPRLEVYLLPAHASSTIINMVIRNVGRGAARDIKWEIIADETDLEAHGVRLLKMSIFQALHYLPGQETIKFFFGSALRIFSEPKLKPIKIQVSYKNYKGKKKRSDTFVIDLQPFEGMVTVGLPVEYEVASALKKIQRDLHNIATGLSQPRAITQTEREERREQKESVNGAQDTLRQIQKELQALDTESSNSKSPNGSNHTS